MIRAFSGVAAALCCSLAAAQSQPAVVELLPQGASATERLPTVIALHGRGGNAATFAGFVRRLAPEARIVSLQAPTYLGDGYTWLQTRVAHRDAARMRVELTAALTLLRPRIREILESRPSCGRPLIVGFSQGGVLALALAAERFEGVAAFVDLAGALPSGYPVRDGTATAQVISLHGREDTTVPIAATRRALQGLRKAGIPVRAVELPGGHDATPQLRSEARRAIAQVLGQECRRG